METRAKEASNSYGETFELNQPPVSVVEYSDMLAVLFTAKQHAGKDSAATDQFVMNLLYRIDTIHLTRVFVKTGHLALGNCGTFIFVV